MNAETGIHGIVLYGRLKEEFGEAFPVIGNCVAKVLTIMEANFPNRFLKSLQSGEYFVWLEKPDGKEVGLETPEALIMGTSRSRLHVMPRIEGSAQNKGGLTALLGVALVGAAIFFTGGLAAGSISLAIQGLQGTMWGTIAQFGVGMILSGISQLLSPMPDDPSEQEDSSIYSGAANTITEGGAIPVLYGAPYVSSIVISAGLDAETKMPVVKSEEIALGGGTATRFGGP